MPDWCPFDNKELLTTYDTFWSLRGPLLSIPSWAAQLAAETAAVAKLGGGWDGDRSGWEGSNRIGNSQDGTNNRGIVFDL